jgi:hypothetical protein
MESRIMGFFRLNKVEPTCVKSEMQHSFHMARKR